MAPPAVRESQPGQVAASVGALFRPVRYEGEEGHVVEGHMDKGRAGEEASVVLSVRGAHDTPRRNVTVPESRWGELELLR